MKSYVASILLALVSVAGLDVNGIFAQQVPVKRNFEAEIQTALASAKAAAGFEFLGTLVRTCLLPQSGGESTSDNVPGYVTNPATAPARDTWYAEPSKVFDNLDFVGGKLHSSWALTTKDGIILFDTLSLQLGGIDYRWDAEGWPRSDEYKVCSYLPRPW